MSAFALAFGFAPVVLFLLGLRLMDSFKLVHRSTLFTSLGAGAVAAGIAFALNRSLIEVAHVPPTLLSVGIAPVLEESLKAALVVWLVRRHEVGFSVDAAIAGFATGTGFALVENLYYAGALGDMSL